MPQRDANEKPASFSASREEKRSMNEGNTLLVPTPTNADLDSAGRGGAYRHVDLHFDENHNRPDDRSKRMKDSIFYTCADVKTRLFNSCSGCTQTYQDLKSTCVAFPQKASLYTQDTFTFYRKNPVVLRKEFLSGCCVALLQVPESVAFSYVAGLEPTFGLYATVFMGILTSLFGGKPGMISGAAGALAVVVADLTDRTSGPLKHLATDEERVQHLLMTMVFTGVIQIVFGVFGLSKFFSLIPSTANIGFLNGLSLIMFTAQLPTFKKCTDPRVKFEECEAGGAEKVWMGLNEAETWMNLAIITTTMLIMFFWPKIPKIGSVVPASLVALIIGSVFEHGINRRFLNGNVRTVKDTAPISGGFPRPRVPDVGDNADWGVIIEYAVSLAAIGLFESIMTLQVVNEITKTPVTARACTKESIAQGLGNLVSGFFSAMGGDAMIGQSTINVLNGARYRLSGVIAGLGMLLIVLAASSVVELIPIASLTGVLFMVVVHTFYWPTFTLLFRLHLVDVITIVGVTVLAVVTNLAIAALAGIIWHALVTVWEHGKLLQVKTALYTKKQLASGEVAQSPVYFETNVTRVDAAAEKEMIKVYYLEGPLLFGSTRLFRTFFEVDTDPEHVILDFAESLVCDFPAVTAIREIAVRYRDAGKRMTVRHVCYRSKKQFRRDRDWVMHEHEQEPLNHTRDVFNVTGPLNPITGLDVFHTDPVLVHMDASSTNPRDLMEDLVENGDLQEESPKKSV